tara:strand:+ start:1141 stop:1479 length:339 start_codon:yes stop_codon:yes gene_type:complete
MRVIEKKMCDALVVSRESASLSNTTVTWHDGVGVMKLFGNQIARAVRRDNGQLEVYVSDGDYGASRTTARRLNALFTTLQIDCGVFISKGYMYIGMPDGTTTLFAGWFKLPL